MFLVICYELQKQEIYGLDELVSPNGTISQDYLVEIIKVSDVEWKKENGQRGEKSSASSINENDFNQALEEEKVRERMNEIDFNKKLSSADYVYLSDHFSQFFKIATDEQKEAHVKATFSNFGEEKKEDFISVFSNLLKKSTDGITIPDEIR